MTSSSPPSSEALHSDSLKVRRRRRRRSRTERAFPRQCRSLTQSCCLQKVRRTRFFQLCHGHKARRGLNWSLILDLGCSSLPAVPGPVCLQLANPCEGGGGGGGMLPSSGRPHSFASVPKWSRVSCLVYRGRGRTKEGSALLSCDEMPRFTILISA